MSIKFCDGQGRVLAEAHLEEEEGRAEDEEDGQVDEDEDDAAVA